MAGDVMLDVLREIRDELRSHGEILRSHGEILRSHDDQLRMHGQRFEAIETVLRDVAGQMVFVSRTLKSSLAMREQLDDRFDALEDRVASLEERVPRERP
jgi:chromosome segregation ATPase